MHDISDFNRDGLPSAVSLIKATIFALVLGAVVLLTTVMPAEFGIDPTGLGARMGLTALSHGSDHHEQPENLLASVGPGVASVWKSASAFRTDTQSVILQPGEGTEIKAKMQEGERFVFSWEAKGGVVNFDMHGEPPGNGEDFTSYWKGVNQGAGHGEFVAPFAGTHGWYWRNRGKDPVTVSVSISGYYEKLYQP